jgi:diguanylate cyclase (GGDEF)-like protein
MRALIYDTDRLRLATLARNLQDLGLEWIAVTAPDKVKPQIGKTQFDLIILDESATELIRPLRKLDPGVPIIIVVDGDTTLDFERLFFEGVEGIISRPYRLDFFKQIVDKALAQRKHTLLHLKTVASLQQKVRELETLNEIVQAISSSLQPREILDIIMEKTAELIKAEGWSLLLLDQEKQELVFEAAAGEAGKKLLGMRLRVGQGVAGWVAHYGQSIIVPDVTKDPRFYAGVDKKTKFVTKSILCVPMKSRDKIIGVVEVVNKIGGEPFTTDDLDIFENLVAHITIALHNATLYRKMEEASLIDDLTQLYNNRYCKEYLDRYLNKRKDSPAPLSLIFMDIDYFKLVDDNFGHLVGSETLRYVGERIRKTVRTCDVVVRYGGDEYIIILPNTDKSTAAVIAERVRKEIKREPFYAFGNKKFSITITSGIATYPDDAKTRDDLIGAADKAMYEGKLSGRDKVVLA